MVDRITAKSPTYRSYESMLYRCYNKNQTYYHRYGGRGVEVCERWKNSFVSFLEDMGVRPEGMTLDRIDNNGNYEPDNCRWATQSEQGRNSESASYITAFGETKCISEWAEDSRCKTNLLNLYKRLNEGWVPERAISVPTKKVKGWNHGTYTGYNNKCRCEDCVEAGKSYRRKRREASLPDSKGE